MKHIKEFNEFINENQNVKEIEKLLDAMHSQKQKVKDSNYDIKEIKKLEKIERKLMKTGVVKGHGSAWFKGSTPKELHKKYKDYGYTWMEEYD